MFVTYQFVILLFAGSFWQSFDQRCPDEKAEGRSA
jgi:hypothetical protein